MRQSKERASTALRSLQTNRQDYESPLTLRTRLPCERDSRNGTWSTLSPTVREVLQNDCSELVYPWLTWFIAPTIRHFKHRDISHMAIDLDVIFALSISQNGLDTIMSVTDKSNIQLVPGKPTETATQWARLLIDRLGIVDWRIPRAVDSDRDKEFLSELCSSLLRHLRVSLLHSTAYNPKLTDKASAPTRPWK